MFFTGGEKNWLRSGGILECKSGVRIADVGYSAHVACYVRLREIYVTRDEIEMLVSLKYKY